MIRPNLFIIGAPKCGTSSLFNWLIAHPDVCGSLKKEPFFLMDSGHPLANQCSVNTVGMEAYAKLFPKDAGRYKYIIEATTHYIYQDNALNTIASWPDAKIIIVMRKPEERVFSSFVYSKYNLSRLNREISFRQYISIISSGKSLYPEFCLDRGSAYVLERDIDYSKYIKYVKKWTAALGRSRVFPVLLENIHADQGREVKVICNWLGLANDEFSASRNNIVKNKTEINRSEIIHRAVLRLNGAFRIPPYVKRPLISTYRKLMLSGPLKRSLDDLAVLAALNEFYRPYNSELEKLLDVDLSVWNDQGRLS